ncbi:RipA family octameric membrane protein [Vibrio vulnificus]|uniref:RipA family octameric membrane protein n=1 Tax=Vibrio vulnificus TaxID=672 RepID=UPI003EDA60F1
MTDSTPLRQSLSNADVECSSQQLELYKLSVEMADRISARRLTANSFFLTINTGIIAFAGYLSLSVDKNLAAGQYWVVALAGVILCYMWYRLIRSYAGLNKAKFDVIHEMEKDLPYKVFDAEWIAVGQGNDPKKYLPFTKIEMAVPWVFLGIHGIVLLKAAPWGFLRTLVCGS